MASEIGRFKAKTDDGTVYEIVEYGTRVDASHLGGNASIDGLGELWTSDGWSRVNFIDEETFKIVSTGEIARKLT